MADYYLESYLKPGVALEVIISRVSFSKLWHRERLLSINAEVLSSPGHSSGFGKHVIISQLIQFFDEDTERNEGLAEAQFTSTDVIQCTNCFYHRTQTCASL